MSRLFLDTGYVIALEASDDQNHDAATRHWRSLAPSPPLLVTTSYVFAGAGLRTKLDAPSRVAVPAVVGRRIAVSLEAKQRAALPLPQRPAGAREAAAAVATPSASP